MRERVMFKSTLPASLGLIGAAARGPKGKSAEHVRMQKLQRHKARLECAPFKARAIIDAEKSLPRSWGSSFRRAAMH